MDEQTQCNKCKRFYSKDEMHNCTMKDIMLEYEFHVDLHGYKGTISTVIIVNDRDKDMEQKQLYKKYRIQAMNEFTTNWMCKHKEN